MTNRFFVLEQSAKSGDPVRITGFMRKLEALALIERYERAITEGRLGADPDCSYTLGEIERDDT